MRDIEHFKQKCIVKPKSDDQRSCGSALCIVESLWRHTVSANRQSWSENSQREIIFSTRHCTLNNTLHILYTSIFVSMFYANTALLQCCYKLLAYREEHLRKNHQPLQLVVMVVVVVTVWYACICTVCLEHTFCLKKKLSITSRYLIMLSRSWLRLIKSLRFRYKISLNMMQRVKISFHVA